MGPSGPHAGGRALRGWGRRIRTPATRARTWRPTTRRSPTDPPSPRTVPQLAEGVRHARPRGARGGASPSAQRVPEDVAGPELGHPGGGDGDLPAGAGVPAVAGGPAGYHEGAEAAEGHALPAVKRVPHRGEEGVDGAIRGDL